jgi:hypothetical protein
MKTATSYGGLRVAAAVLIAAGTTGLFAGLCVAGAVATLLLDTLTSDGGGGAGGCVGAEVGPLLILAAAGMSGAVGVVLIALGGQMFWRLTAPRAASSDT